MAGLIYNLIVYICWWRNGKNYVKIIQVGHTHIIERLARPGKAGANYSLTIVVLCVSALTPLKLADPASAGGGLN